MGYLIAKRGLLTLRSRSRSLFEISLYAKCIVVKWSYEVLSFELGFLSPFVAECWTSEDFSQFLDSAMVAQ